MKRGYNFLRSDLAPSRSLDRPSVYVAGRGYNHSLWVMIGIMRTKHFLSAMRPLNRKAGESIFPHQPNIVQEDYKVTDPKNRHHV